MGCLQGKRMFDKLIKMKKVTEVMNFQMAVEKELVRGGNEEWKRKIADYVKVNDKEPYISWTVIGQWSELSVCLRNACYYEEAYLMAKLAIDRSEDMTGNLADDFLDIRIEALQALGIAQLECTMLQETVRTFEKAWKMLKTKMRSYVVYRCMCGINLATAYLRVERYEDSEFILDFLEKWILEEQLTKIAEDSFLNIKLMRIIILYQKREFDKGTKEIKALEQQMRSLNLKNHVIYYKVLALYGLFEKMNHNLKEYYELTKKAVKYAKKAGDLQEEQSYQVNLMDALMRLGKNKDMLLQIYDIKMDLKSFGKEISNLNVLQSYMGVLMMLFQYSPRPEELELEQEASMAWERLKARGMDLNSRESLKIQSQFAMIKFFKKKYREAQKELLICIEQSRKILGEGDIDTLASQEALAGCYRMQREYKEALAQYLKIKKLREHYGQQYTHSYFETIRSIAYMYHFTGEKKEAVRYLLQYFEGLDQYSFEVFLIFDESAWKNFLASFLNTLHDFLGWMVLVPEDSANVKEIYELVLRFKNRIYNEELRWKKRQESVLVYPKMKEYYQLLNEQKNFQDGETQLQYMKQKLLLEEEISKLQPDFLKTCVSLEDIQCSLKGSEAVLDYVLYNKDTEYEEFEKKEEGYIVFLITKRSIEWYDLGSAEDIDYAMEEFYQIVSLVGCDKTYLEQQLIQVRAGIGLYNFEDQLTGMKKIYLGTDGMWMPRMPWRYIFLNQEIQVLPSFIYFKESAKKLQSESKDVIFFVNPDLLNAKENDAMKKSLLITRTTEALIANRIGRKLNSYLGENIDKKDFLLIKSPKVLHVAAHGFYVPENEDLKKSVILMGSEKKEKDVIITMLDVMQMDLSGTKLVILDSCKTGIGDFRKDEGVYSFVRAFLIAGADAVLSCLWNVDATFSVVFLDYFYEYYMIDGDAQKALEKTQISIRKMTAEDVYRWLEDKRESISSFCGEKESLNALEESINKLIGSEKKQIFDVPAYWACFELTASLLSYQDKWLQY